MGKKLKADEVHGRRAGDEEAMEACGASMVVAEVVETSLVEEHNPESSKAFTELIGMILPRYVLLFRA